MRSHDGQPTWRYHTHQNILAQPRITRVLQQPEQISYDFTLNNSERYQDFKALPGI